MWQVIARDRNLDIVGVLRGWEISATLRFNTVGTIELKVPREATPDGWPAPGDGLVLVRDGAVVASGCFDEDGFEWSAEPGADPSGQGFYTLTADTDLGRLAYRVIYPNPAEAWKDQGNVDPEDPPEATPETHYIYPPLNEGLIAAEEVLRETVYRQAANGARPARRVAGLRLSPGSNFLGTPTRIVERFTPLLDALRKVARAGGNLSFDARDTLRGTIDFSVSETRDLTETVRFGVELGNVLRLSVRRVSPVATAVLIAADGDMTQRRLGEFARASDYGRREYFVDMRSIDPELNSAQRQAEFEKQAEEVFASSGEQTAVSAEIIDTPAIRWGRDFNLGDRVSVMTPHGPVSDIIREVAIRVDATGLEEIVSTIGTASPTVDDPLADTVRMLQNRISNIERGK